MAKPEPELIDPTELPALVQAVMRMQNFPCSEYRWRSASTATGLLKTDGFTVCVANLKAYHKTQEIAANPKVELCYMDSRHDQVRIISRAEVLDDATRFNPSGTQPAPSPIPRHPGQPHADHDKIIPEQVRFMREWALEYHEVDLS